MGRRTFLNLTAAGTILSSGSVTRSGSYHGDPMMRVPPRRPPGSASGWPMLSDALVSKTESEKVNGMVEPVLISVVFRNLSETSFRVPAGAVMAAYAPDPLK